MYACQLLSCILLLVLIKSVFVGPPSRITMNWCKYIHSEIIWNIKLHFVMIMISRGLKCVPYLKLLELHKCHFLYNQKQIHSKAGANVIILCQTKASLTIAIVFELLYLWRAMSWMWLTSTNIDPKCHSYPLKVK